MENGSLFRIWQKIKRQKKILKANVICLKTMTFRKGIMSIKGDCFSHALCVRGWLHAFTLPVPNILLWGNKRLFSVRCLNGSCFFFFFAFLPSAVSLLTLAAFFLRSPRQQYGCFLIIFFFGFFISMQNFLINEKWCLCFHIGRVFGLALRKGFFLNFFFKKVLYIMAPL